MTQSNGSFDVAIDVGNNVRMGSRLAKALGLDTAEVASAPIAAPTMDLFNSVLDELEAATRQEAREISARALSRLSELTRERDELYNTFADLDTKFRREIAALTYEIRKAKIVRLDVADVLAGKALFAPDEAPEPISTSDSASDSDADDEKGSV